MKLLNKDKQLIRRALFNQVENLVFAIGDENSGYYDEFQHLIDDDGTVPDAIADYCYKIIGLYPA